MPSEPAERDVTTTVRYWVAGCSVSEDLWRYRRESKTVTCDARGRYLLGERGALVWPDYVLASEIDTLAVQGDQLDRLRFELWWSPDDAFSAERSLGPAAARSGPHEVRFELSASPEWKGRVRRFRLTWTGSTTPATRVLGAWASKRASTG